VSTVKIPNRHCERLAYVYVRQSTPWQVIEHRESTERQYHLRDRALEVQREPQLTCSGLPSGAACIFGSPLAQAGGYFIVPMSISTRPLSSAVASSTSLLS
jgi:hypothetical protein